MQILLSINEVMYNDWSPFFLIANMHLLNEGVRKTLNELLQFSFLVSLNLMQVAKRYHYNFIR